MSFRAPERINAERFNERRQKEHKRYKESSDEEE